MIKFLKHFFFPQVSNNYRPRILHPKILIIAILFFFSSGILSSFVRENYPSILGVSTNMSADQLLAITNQDRQQNGLPPLILDGQLNQAAVAKGQDMLSKNYWAHVSPTGTPPWYFIKSAGYNYVYAGENLARGYISAQDVVNAWMTSSTHRENMLSNKYSSVGFAVLTGNLTGEDTVLVVEMLGSTSLAGGQNIGKTEQIVAAPSQSTPSLIQTPTPTSIPTQILAKPKVAINKTNQSAFASNTSTNSGTLINAANFSSNIARTAALIFIFVLILDMVIIERKKILRFVGHNLDHILFFGLIFALILVILKGQIL